MAKEEKARLKTLLSYWIEHNREHGDEFKDWAERVKAFRETGIAGDLLAASGEMEKVNERLDRALKRLA